MRAVPAARDGSRSLLLHPWRSQHPWPLSSPRVRARCTRRWCARWGRRTDHRHRQLAALDHDFRADAHARQQVSPVAGGFCLRDVDHMVSHGAIILSFIPRHRIRPLKRPDRPSAALLRSWVEVGGRFLFQRRAGMRGRVDLLEVADRHLRVPQRVHPRAYRSL